MLKRLFLRKKTQQPIETEIEEAKNALQTGIRLVDQGKRKECIELLAPYLEKHPNNVAILNQLAIAQGELGNIREAEKLFIKSYTLDETNIAAILNHASLLMDNKDNTAAWEVIKLGKFADPTHSGIATTYSTYLFAEGRATEALPYKLEAWMGAFDSLRTANGYLFSCSYDQNMSELQLAQEHFFWSETHQEADAQHECSSIELPHSPVESRKIRIGYISPDVKFHSVSYFFRPILQNHNTEKFDIILFDDTVIKDDITSEIISDTRITHHETSTLSNSEIIKLILSERLDILVELCGHTSHNRMDVLKQRLAYLQITGLGYPPTTGLRSINYKLSDRWIHHEDDAPFYSETPLTLQHSFWCFDPVTAIPYSTEIPYDKNGYITFGCQGNIAKISEKLLDAWAIILSKISDSRISIRSINFKDPGVADRFQQRLKLHNIPAEKIILLPPTTSVGFFQSYNDVDIILDTYPFNGGTTTAFSLYMGTPVVSIYGQALQSRMGLSMLSNLGLHDLACKDIETYIHAAIELAANPARLRSIKAGLRQSFIDSPLGNGKKFTSDYENSLIDALTNPIPVKHPQHLPALPPTELVKRGYLAIANNNQVAANRIAEYCLLHYPSHGPAHVLYTTRYTAQGDTALAFEYLQEQAKSAHITHTERVFVALLRLEILLGKQTSISDEILEDIRLRAQTDEVDKLQLRALQAGRSLAFGAKTIASKPISRQATRLHIVIATDLPAHFENARNLLSQSLDNSEVYQFHFTPLLSRAQFLRKLCENLPRDEILLYLPGNAIPSSSQLLQLISDSLRYCDILSFCGTSQYDRHNWDFSRFSERHGSFLIRCPENSSLKELFILGNPKQNVVNDVDVLSGRVLAFRAGTLLSHTMDESLSRAEFLMEEQWTFNAKKSGAALGVHYKLLPLFGYNNPPLVENLTSCRNSVAEKMNWEPFPSILDDPVVVTVPIRNEDEACYILDEISIPSYA